MRVLIVEDEAKIREFVALFIKKEGHEIIEAEDGQQGIELFENSQFDLVLLDIMMPKVNGFQVCKKIRETSSVPIIILTAIEEDSDQIKGYELGADDYVLKPFKIQILMAKVRRLLKAREERSMKLNASDKVFKYEALLIDFSVRKAYVNNTYIKMTPKEFDLLEYLVMNKGLSLSRDKLLEFVWGYDFEGGSRVVDNHIKKLRNKLSKYGHCIETVVSIGYRFVIKG